MAVGAVLAPVFVEVALIMILGIALSWSRTAAIKAGAVRVADIPLGRAVWPARPTQIGASYANQFELPVLFFALVPLAMVTRQADLVFVVLAWLFVVFRVVHAGIHTTSNALALRGPAFLASAVVLALAWMWLGFKILSAGVA